MLQNMDILTIIDDLLRVNEGGLDMAATLPSERATTPVARMGSSVDEPLWGPKPEVPSWLL